VEDARELNSDVAGANDDRALRELLEIEEAVRVEAVLVAGDVGRERRSAADRNDEAIRRVLALDVGSAVSLRLGVRRQDVNRLLVEESGVTSDVVNAVLFDVCTEEEGQRRFSASASPRSDAYEDSLRS
jgi:hypothetical protein